MSRARSRRASPRSRHGARKDQHRNHARVAAETAAVIRKQLDPQYVADVKSFELGVRLFHRESLGKARQIFEKLSVSTYPEIADRARLHLRLCDQRQSRPAPNPKTAQEYYVLGVAELNARKLESAVEHLKRADRLEPNGDHIRYALAAAHALHGNTEVALEHLKAAIVLRPGNGFQARRDADFQSLASDQRFLSLVSGNAAASAAAGS